jgi:hypothetical protein
VDDRDNREALPHPRVCHNIQRDQPVNNILGDIEKGVTTRPRVTNFCEFYLFVSSFEPFKIEDALHDPDWVVAMQEELKNFKHIEVWSLVERSKLNIVGTKWVFRMELLQEIKHDLWQKTIHKSKVWILIKKLESIQILVAYATHHDFKLYQMDVKSAFLNGLIKEEVYVEQPPSFKSEEYPNHVYKLHKTLYGLKQAPRAWYECLRDFLIDNGFKIGKGDSTLFTRRMGKDLFVF